MSSVDAEQEAELNQILEREACKSQAAMARKEYLARYRAEDPYWKDRQQDASDNPLYKSGSIEQNRDKKKQRKQQEKKKAR